MSRSNSPLLRNYQQEEEVIQMERQENDNEFRYDGIMRNNDYRPRYFHYIPRLFRFDNSVEATAIAIDNFVRGTIMMASVFIGPALLELAREQAISDAGCNENDAECIDTARVYGFRPSSLLTNIATISGILSAVALPLAGAIIDHTPHRRKVGLYSALSMSLMKAVEIGISLNTWFLMSLLQLVTGILFQLLSVTEYAYGAELSGLPTEQSKYQAHFFLCMFIALILYLLQVLIPAKLKQLDDVQTAQFGALICALWSAPLSYLSWTVLLPNRPALHRIPPNQTLLSAGFSKLYKTYQSIRSDLPAVNSFLLSSMFCEGANWSINTVAITYFKEYLGLSSQLIGIVIFILVVGGIPGTFLGKHISLLYGPVASSKVCLVVFIAVISFAGFCLTPDTRHIYVFLFSFFLGTCKGWLHPIMTALYVTIIPKGQEVEMMGVYFFCAHVFTFLPPMFFTMLNEAGLSMSWGMVSLNIFFILGVLFLNQIKDYQEAMRRVSSPDRRDLMSNELIG